MTVKLFDIYRSSNIGLFLNSTEKYAFVPFGIPAFKLEYVEKVLDVELIQTSLAGSSLIKILSAINNNGMLVSNLVEHYELQKISNYGINVSKLSSNYTSVGNLVVANDYGAIASTLLNEDSISQIKQKLKVDVFQMNIATHLNVGSVLVASNSGAIIHPEATESEITKVSEILNVDVFPCTINGGIPYVSSGIVLNSKNALIGSSTTGTELMMITKAFDL